VGKHYTEIPDKLQRFIAAQQIFFVATAAADGRVNLSPKGMDSLRILDRNRVAWLNLTGSGNETAAHILENPRMTLMFAAFEGDPLILRLYGHAEVVHRNDPSWDALQALFPTIPGTRQFFDVAVDLVLTSCGMAVPYFDFVGERQLLNDWAAKKGPQGLQDYWEEKNQFSIDAKPTNILSKNT